MRDARTNALGVLVLLVGGCGLFGGTEGTTPEDVEVLRLSEVAGGRVVVLRRPTRGLVHLSLWIDAGARDADPPQLATVAAWAAADRAGQGLRVRVLPDGTAFEVMCEAGELEPWVARLGRVLAAREVSDALLTRLRRHLAHARRVAATDEGRTADALALEALLGEAARGMRPFGDAARDAQVTADAVAGFLAAHYGPTRAMLVAAGDISAGRLERAAAEVLGASPPATARRATRGLSADGTAPRVEVGEESTVAVAALLPDLGAAAAAVRAVANADVAPHLDGEPPVVHAFEVRGGALLIARVAHRDLERASIELAYAVGRALAEGEHGSAPELGDDPVAAARDLGMRWLADGAPAPATDGRVAIGAVVAGGRADAAGEGGDPNRAIRERAIAILSSARDRAAAFVRPRTRGRVTDDAASVVADNGARIDVRRRPGDRRAAIAVRVAGGAAADPPALHGRAAMMAVIAAEGCPPLGAGGLAAHLATMGATMVPRVDASSWGLVVEAPRDRWAEALELALRCALSTAPDRGDVERARLVLLDRLQGGAEMAAWAARAVSPEAPGRVAPLGRADAVRGTSTAAVRRAWRTGAVGGRVAVAVVGAVPVEEAVARAARRLARLPAGTAPPPPAPVRPVPTEGPLAEEWDGPHPRAVVAFRVARGALPAATARAVAEVVAGALGRRPGLSAVWWDGGADGRGAWAAVALDATEEALATLPDTVRAATAEVGEEAVAEARARLARARARASASPAHVAAELARRRLDGEAREAGGAAAALAGATPRFVIGRPRDRGPENRHARSN